MRPMVNRERDRPAKGLALGVDLGGTKILAGVVDAAHRVLGRGKVKTPFAGGEAALSEALVAACDAALAEAGVGREDVKALGLGAPGPLDAERGIVLRANHLAVKKYEVAKAFGAAFPRVTPRLENDVRLAALGEAHLGAGRGARMMIAIWVGTGIGGGVVLDGKLWTGRNRNAGEIGQMLIDWKAAEPGTPEGTFELAAAKVGIGAYLRRQLEKGGRTSLKKIVSDEGARLKTSELKAALDAGDALAKKAVARSAKAVGIAMASLFDAISPDLFVLGGGVAVDLGETYLQDVRRWAEAFAFTTELGSIEIAPAALGDDAGLLGAALYARGA
jgi:glucokinase